MTSELKREGCDMLTVATALMILQPGPYLPEQENSIEIMCRRLHWGGHAN